MLQREDFHARIDNQQAIHAHEIQYPIMQGWDSVMVRADVELGGTDQLFNILVGRDFQKEEGQPQQVVFLLPILEGLDGSKKMSKSLGNYVGITDPSKKMFGDLMGISDKLMARYYPLLLGRSLAEDADPLEAKKQLAFEIVQTYHSTNAAKKELNDWKTRVSEKDLAGSDLPEFSPTEFPEFWPFTEVYGSKAWAMVWGAYSQVFQVQKSSSEIRRLITQGSVQLDGVKITDPKATLDLKSGQILRLDKTHAVRIAP
jgi:tyrosyl-tRNA synthetase